jgi:hypothetical protein
MSDIADQQEINRLNAKVEALEGWKAQALAVEAEWDVQAIGKRLDVPLGSSIRAAILPAIDALELEVMRLQVVLQKLATFDYSTDEKISIARNALERCE